jgi:hypothetical protein
MAGAVFYTGLRRCSASHGADLVATKGPAVAGQQVRLVVTVLTTTWFLHAPAYPQITAPNAIINLLDEQPDNLNQTINGKQWFGLSRSYLVTPAGSGDVVIPPFEITLYPGQASGAMKVKTHEIKLAVKVVPRPAGTENMLASTHVQISQKLDRKLDDLKVGDAFTRTVEVDAAGAQGMFIPPTTFATVKGLTVYPKTGKVDNIIKDRVGFLGSHRRDAATYVIQQEGSYELPAVSIEWWNTSTGKIEKAEAPALKFNAAPNPGYKPEFGLPEEAQGAAPVRKQINWHFVAAIASAIVLGLALIYWLARQLPHWLQRLHAWRTAKRQRYEASEATAYKRFEQAAHGRDAKAAYTALLVWVEHPNRPLQERGLAALCKGRPTLTAQVDALRASAYGGSAAAWQSQTLLKEIAGLRHTQAPTQHSGPSLQPLNPA